MEGPLEGEVVIEVPGVLRRVRGAAERLQQGGLEDSASSASAGRPDRPTATAARHVRNPFSGGNPEPRSVASDTAASTSVKPTVGIASLTYTHTTADRKAPKQTPVCPAPGSAALRRTRSSVTVPSKLRPHYRRTTTSNLIAAKMLRSGPTIRSSAAPPRSSATA